MVLKVRWAGPAIEELTEALDYIGQHNPDAAGNLERKAKASTRKLARFPESGRIVPEFEIPTLRETIVGPFRIIYRTLPEEVRIVAAIRAERLLDPGIPERS